MALARPNLRFSTTLYQAADNLQTTLYPNAVPVTVPCYLIVDPKTETEEIVKVTDKSTNSITVVRAQGGTSATAHSVGAAVVDYNIPQYFDDLADAYENVFNDDGTPKSTALVTPTGVQTLTNKTLTSPVLNGNMTGTGVVDEDNMVSDSATKLPTQQSVKAYVDSNSGSSDGWTETGEILTYASASTFTVPGDQTAKYTKGTRLKFNQTSVKYAVVIASSFSTNTTVTIAVNTDYTIANSAITAPFYSYQLSPQGYPGWFNYAPTFGGFTPTGGTKKFKIDGNTLSFTIYGMTQVVSTSTTSTITVPVAPATAQEYGGPVVVNNSSAYALGHISFNTTTTQSIYAGVLQVAWSGSSGNKNLAIPVLSYEF